MRRPSFSPRVVGSASTAACMRVAASAAASGVGKSASSSSPMVFTTRPRLASAACRSASTQRAIASTASRSPADS
jgi:hypothetical protein